MRLIDADNLKIDLDAEIIFDSRDRYRVRDLIDIQMTIEAEPVRRGRWKMTPTAWLYCSICGCEPPCETNIPTNYCPNCGARMEGEVMTSDEEWIAEAIMTAPTIEAEICGENHCPFCGAKEDE